MGTIILFVTIRVSASGIYFPPWWGLSPSFLEPWGGCPHLSEMIYTISLRSARMSSLLFCSLQEHKPGSHSKAIAGTVPMCGCHRPPTLPRKHLQCSRTA